MRAIALLSAFKFRNSLRTLFSDPRKLLPVIVILVSTTCLLVLLSFRLSSPRQGSVQENFDGAAFSTGVSLALILLALSFIDSGLGDGLLAFSSPDVDYLFPSPIARRAVLVYKLPGLIFGGMIMAGFVLVMFNMATSLGQPKMPNPGHTAPLWWVNPAALFLSGSIYMNLAMFISVSVNNRRKIHQILMTATAALACGLGLLAWARGTTAVEKFVHSPLMHWTFLPSSLASESLLAGYAHQPATGPLVWLLAGYFLSHIPMFTSNANWYEQSIVSTERLAASRQAAKGGYATIMAARAATSQRKRGKGYTLPPFGQGAVALFWAHLCASAKKPIANFVGPLIGGIAAGGLAATCAAANIDTAGIGYSVLVMIGMYCSMGFVAAAKTAAHAAIRRRELLAPLPIAGWKSVAANLGSPFCTAMLFFSGCAGAYAIFRGPNWLLIVFGFGLGLPLRIAARMVLQYIVVIGYPDYADKVQQFIATWVYSLAASPFLAIEAILCIPGLLLHSVWVILIPLTLFQIVLLAAFLFFAGKASEKAVATGEPVRILSLVKCNVVGARTPPSA